MCIRDSWKNEVWKDGIGNIDEEHNGLGSFKSAYSFQMCIRDRKYCAAPGRGLANVLFKDITYNGENAERSIIAGYNEERKVKNIRFENLRINGEEMCIRDRAT